MSGWSAPEKDTTGMRHTGGWTNGIRQTVHLEAEDPNYLALNIRPRFACSAVALGLC